MRLASRHNRQHGPVESRPFTSPCRPLRSPELDVRNEMVLKHDVPVMERRLRRVIDYVDAHIATPIALDEMAEVACLSRFHFVRAFKSHTGMTPCQYVGRLRIEYAKVLLRDGHRSLAHIANALLFSSQSTFTRAFRKATGVTPLQYASGATVRTDSGRFA